MGLRWQQKVQNPSALVLLRGQVIGVGLHACQVAHGMPEWPPVPKNGKKSKNNGLEVANNRVQAWLEAISMPIGAPWGHM